MGPKSDNVKNRRVSPLLFEGSRSHEGAKESLRLSEPRSFDVEKVRFLIKNALCRHLELCFLCRRGAQIQKNNKNMLPICK